MVVDGLVGQEEYLFQILETCICCWYLFTQRDTEEEGMQMPVFGALQCSTTVPIVRSSGHVFAAGIYLHIETPRRNGYVCLLWSLMIFHHAQRGSAINLSQLAALKSWLTAAHSRSL